MKKSTLLLFTALAVCTFLTLTGCGKVQKTPVQRVSAKLNAGGCYFEVYDYTRVPAQMDFLLARIRPAAEPLYAELELPFSLDEALKKIKTIGKTAGFDRIEASGQSSIVLYGSQENLPYFFHNRVVVDTGVSGEIPAFLMPFSGAPITLQAFAKSVPEGATAASSVNLDWGALYRWVSSQWPLPESTLGMFGAFVSCPAEDFFKGISGRYNLIILDSNPQTPRASLQIPDQENRIFALTAKFTLQDANAGEITVKLPEDIQPENTDCRDVQLVKGENTLTLYLGKDTQKIIAEQLAAGKTFAKRADFTRLTSRMPASASGYGISDYSAMNLREATERSADNGKYVEFAAYEVSASGLVCYQNGYTDCPVSYVKALLNLLPQLKEIISAFSTGTENQPNIPVPADTPEQLQTCVNNLNALYEVMQNYRKNHNGKLPEAMGLTGLRELFKDAPTDFPAAVLACPVDPFTEVAKDIHQLLWLNLSYIYMGALPDSIPAATRPLLAEYPPLGHRNPPALCVLFADGHVEKLTPPETVNCMEKLMSYLHTQKKYSEADLNVLMARGKVLDQMLEKELIEEDQMLRK